MVLVDYQLRELCEAGLLKPYDPELINPASIDVRIGDTAYVELPEGWRDYDMSQHTEANPFWLSPKEFVLVATLETFNMPNTVSGEFRIKSSRAREGFDNALAVWLDAGWSGSKLTLELVNNCRYQRLPLWKRRRIGQIILHPCNAPLRNYSLTGRYNHDRACARSKG